MVQCKEPTCSSGDTGDMGSILGLGRSSGEGHGNPLQYSCLEKPHGQRSLTTLHGIAKSQTRLSKQSTAHKTIKMTLVRPLMTNFKVTVRADCAVSACSHPPSGYKSYCPLTLSGGRWPLDRCTLGPHRQHPK